MAFASLSDINVHLPADKLVVLDTDDDELQREAERVIRGYLANIYSPALLASWTTPDGTPEQIRGIAGRIIAAFVYARAFSEDSTEVPEYAQSKYDEAMRMLNGVADGSMVLLLLDGTTIEQSHSESILDFHPSDDTDRAFGMDLVF